MDGEEIGLTELRRLIQANWRLILGLTASAGLVTLCVVALLSPSIHRATANLGLYPPVEAQGGVSEPIDVYISLFKSDEVLGKTAQSLIDEDILAKGTKLKLGRDLQIRTEISTKARIDRSVISLTARSQEPAKAAAIANRWAQMSMEESKSMLELRASVKKKALEAQLTPTRQKLQDLDRERTGRLNEFQEREEEIWTEWDERSSAARKKGEKAVAEYQTKTRQLIEEGANRHLQAILGTSVPIEGKVEGDDELSPNIRSKFLEMVTIRAQLAMTPRVVTLQKALDEENGLAEAVSGGGNPADGFDGTLISQELNPLYDQLSLDSLRLESELRNAAKSRLADLSKMLVELERVQVERGSGLAALLEENSFELRILYRRQIWVLRELWRERATAIADYDRKLQQLRDLETRLYGNLNEATISGLLEQVDVVRLAAPAIAQTQPESRRIPLKVAVASFLGGMLGLMISLLRSSATRIEIH